MRSKTDEQFFAEIASEMEDALNRSISAEAVDVSLDQVYLASCLSRIDRLKDFPLDSDPTMCPRTKTDSAIRAIGLVDSEDFEKGRDELYKRVIGVLGSLRDGEGLIEREQLLEVVKFLRALIIGIEQFRLGLLSKHR